MAERRTHRCGQIDADMFRKLSDRSQELFFDYLNRNCTNETYNNLIVFQVVEFKNPFCNSPIEEIFDFAFRLRCFERNEVMWLLPQESINTNNKHYIVDFLFDSDEINELPDVDKLRHFKLVIECDGHDYHKATKEQIAKDNERDMDLKLAGYDILHFSGSQIFNRPWECVDRTIDYIKEKTKG